MENKKEIIEDREALMEMYKAGFLDGYSTNSKPRTDKDWLDLNKAYKLSFMKRFEKKITKIFKKCKEVKT
jgi:hypothetical protein